MHTIYIAGPYTKGDTAANVAKAIEIGEVAAKLGLCPYVPHLTHFWHILYQREYESWLDMGLEWVRHCDALYRISGASKGADREVALALELGKPVFYAIWDMRQWAEGL